MPTVREKWAHTLRLARGRLRRRRPPRWSRSSRPRSSRRSRRSSGTRSRRSSIPSRRPEASRARPRPRCPLERLQALNADLTRVPQGFTIHKKLERVRDKRREALEGHRRADGGLGRRRGPGVCVDSRRRRRDPPDGRGRRARHVQPSARRVPRQRHRRSRRPAAAAVAGAARRSRSTTAR